MSLKYIIGDLLDFPDNLYAIAHQCNIHNKFGAGIAASIKAQYPKAFEADTFHYEQFVNKTQMLGTYSVAEVIPNQWIFNVYAQTLSRKLLRATNYEAFYVAFDRIAESLTTIYDIYKLGVPHGIGCGLGGGDWRIIKATLEVIADKRDIEITIVQLPKQ